MISTIRDNSILYFVVLNLLSSMYLIINQHTLVGILITLFTIIIAIINRKEKKENNITIQDISKIIPYIPFNTTITDSNNHKIASNIKSREILETKDVNEIFENIDSTDNNAKLFKNNEKILKVKLNNNIRYYCTNSSTIEKNGYIIGYINYEFELTDIIECQNKLIERNKMFEFLGSQLEEQINNEVKNRLSSNRNFQDILDNNKDGILIFSYNIAENRVLGFIDSNVTARHLIQQQGLELRNIDIYDLFHSGEKERIEKILRTMVGNKPILFETLMMFDNSITPVEINAHLCKTYNQDTLYLSIRDIRLRKELEIKRDKNRLIAIKNNKAESIVQTLSIIFSKINYFVKEIKEQITTINNNYDIETETKSIIDSSYNINKTIKDLISLYTPSNIKTYIDIKVLIETIKEKIFFKEIVHNTDIQIIQKSEIKEIYCDEDALRYVVWTTISFALENINVNKGTNFYGKINIILQELNNNCILVSIEDNAGGIDNSIISRIFDIFYPTKINNTGLELPTCKVIVEEILLGTMSISNIDDGSRIDIQISK